VSESQFPNLKDGKFPNRLQAKLLDGFPKRIGEEKAKGWVCISGYYDITDT
jgi:hypothetical protein